MFDQQDAAAAESPRMKDADAAAGAFTLVPSQAPPLQVYVVAPALLAWGLQRLIQAGAPRCVVVGSSDRLEDALASLENTPPDVLVLDVDDGYAVQDVARLYERMRVKILVITGACDVDLLEDMLSAGAFRVLSKRETPSMLLRAFESVAQSHVFAMRDPPAPLAPATRRSVPVADSRQAREEDLRRLSSLTLRERQTIAAVISDGAAPAKVIADRLCISEHTLRNHLSTIYSKLGVSGRLALHAYASRYAPGGPTGGAFRSRASSRAC